MFSKLITAAVLSAFSLTSQATQLWSNKGASTSAPACDSLSIDNKGSVTSVSNVFLEGPNGLKSSQQYEQSWPGRYHAECVHNDGYSRGTTRFYSFSFRLQSDWDFQEQSYNLAQFIAPFNNDCDDWMPSTMVWLVGNRLQTRRRWGTVQSANCNKQTHTYTDIATVSAGAWHTVILQVNWQSDATGYFKLWFDGQKVVEEFDVPTTVADGRTFSYRVGLYANGWFDSKNGNPNANGLKGSQSFRQVWYDELAVGTTYADVDPAQWNRKSRIMRGMATAIEVE